MGDLRRRVLLSGGSGGSEEEQDCVDLGLSVLWANGNICKDSSGYYMGEPTDYGAYFSWGNIIGYNEGEGYNFDQTTYNSTTGASVYSDIPSNDSAHDICVSKLGSAWHLPTKEDFQELYDNTDSEWVDDYNGTGVAGCKFMKKTDHSIYVFFPASGVCNSTSLYYRGLYSLYWSSSWSSSTNAYNLYCHISSVIPQHNNSRRSGLSVRAVKLPSTLFKVSTTDGSSREGIVVTLSDGTDTYTYKTDENGEVAVYAPQGTYTVSSTYWTLSINSVTLSGQKEVTLTATKTEEEFVDLGLSVKWASGNICKSGDRYYIGEPTDYGAYFSWGNIIGHNEGEGYNFDPLVYNGTPGISLTGNIASNDASHDAALACLGTGKRMPTKEEYQELYDNCTVTRTSNYNGSGIAGRIFKSKKAGYTDKEIFFPAAGYYDGTSLSNRGSRGLYWSSSYRSSSNAYYLNFDSSKVYPQDYRNRYYGFSVRAVQP